MKNLVTLIYLFLLQASAKGDTLYRGFDSYSSMSPRYPCEKFLEISETPRNPVMSILYGDFGTDTSCLERFTSEFNYKKHLLIIFFSNEACRRKRTCGGGAFKPSLSVHRYNKSLERPSSRFNGEVRERLRIINTILNSVKTPNTEAIVFSGLEDQFTTRAYSNLVHIMRQELSSWIELGRNPVSSHYKTYAPARYYELHGSSGKKHGIRASRLVFSLDGISVDTGERERYRSKISRRQSAVFLRSTRDVFAVRLWTARSQGKDGDFVPHLRRNFRITDRDVTVLKDLLRGY